MALFCRACLSTSLSLVNSVYVCDQCGLQSQLVEEDNDGYEMKAHSRRRAAGGGLSAADREARTAEAERRAAAQAEAKAVPKAIHLVPYEEPAVRAKIKAVAELYVRALQGLVRAQANALVERFGAPPEARGLMRGIWFGFVPLTGLLDAEPRVGGTTVHAYLDKHGYPGLAREGVLGDFNLGGGSNLYGKVTGGKRYLVAGGHRLGTGGCAGGPQEAAAAAKGGASGAKRGGGGGGVQPGATTADAALGLPPYARFHNQGHTRIDFGMFRLEHYIRLLMPPSATLVMTMLTCLAVRMPVSPVDVVRWTLDEALPYHDLEIMSRPLLSSFPFKVATGRLLRAGGSINPRRLFVAAVEMAGALGLALPPLNVEGLLAAATDSLGLPRPVFLVSRELHRLYQLASPLLHPLALGLEGSYPYLPHAALLFAALKLCYGLDNDFVAYAIERRQDTARRREKAGRKRRLNDEWRAYGLDEGFETAADKKYRKHKEKLQEQRKKNARELHEMEVDKEAERMAAAAAGVAAPLLPGVPPLALGPGGWPAWAAARMGRAGRTPVTSAPMNAWEASHLPPSELRAFVAAAEQRLSECCPHRRNRTMKFTRVVRVMDDVLRRMATAAGAAEVQADEERAAQIGQQQQPQPAGGGGGAAGPPEAASASAAATGAGRWPPVAIAVAGPQAAVLAGLPPGLCGAGAAATASASGALHMALEPPPPLQAPPHAPAAAAPPAVAAASSPAAAAVQPAAAAPPASAFAPAPAPAPPPASSASSTFRFNIGALLQKNLHMASDSLAVLALLAWHTSVSLEELAGWVQALLAEMEDVDGEVRRQAMREARQRRKRGWQHGRAEAAGGGGGGETGTPAPAKRRGRPPGSGRGGGRGRGRSRGGEEPASSGRGRGRTPGSGRGRGRGRGQRPGSGGGSEAMDVGGDSEGGQDDSGGRAGGAIGARRLFGRGGGRAGQEHDSGSDDGDSDEDRRGSGSDRDRETGGGGGGGPSDSGGGGSGGGEFEAEKGDGEEEDMGPSAAELAAQVATSSGKDSDSDSDGEESDGEESEKEAGPGSGSGARWGAMEVERLAGRAAATSGPGGGGRRGRLGRPLLQKRPRTAGGGGSGVGGGSSSSSGDEPNSSSSGDEPGSSSSGDGASSSSGDESSSSSGEEASSSSTSGDEASSSGDDGSSSSGEETTSSGGGGSGGGGGSAISDSENESSEGEEDASAGEEDESDDEEGEAVLRSIRRAAARKSQR